MLPCFLFLKTLADKKGNRYAFSQLTGTTWSREKKKKDDSQILVCCFLSEVTPHRKAFVTFDFFIDPLYFTVTTCWERCNNTPNMNWNVATFDSFRFIIKGSLAGAAVYVAYDQGLLGSGAEGAEALKKAQTVLPPAIKEWTSYIGWEVRTMQIKHSQQIGHSLNKEEKT